MFNTIKLAITLAITLACVATGLADEGAKDPVKLDVKGEDVKKYEANQTQIGYSNTRVFYTLGSRQSVVVIQIDNKNKKFPTTGNVYQFAKSVTADDLAKWVNNQHSDGLFPDIPEPIATHQLPADAIKVVSSKHQGQVKGGFRDDTFEKYSVEFEVGAIDLTKQLKLAAFKDSATVYMPAAASK